jgi:ankyrin repeat protein
MENSTDFKALWVAFNNPQELQTYLLSPSRSLYEYNGYRFSKPLIFYAANWGYTDAVRVLLDHDNEPDPTLLYQALPHADMLQLLLERGISPIECDNAERSSFLFSAIGKGYTNIVQYLLDHYYDIAQIDQIALLYDALSNPDMVKLLLDRGISPNLQRQATGYTMLHAAVNSHYIETAKILLNYPDTEINIRSLPCRGEETPLDLAISNGDQDMITLLQKHGAVSGQSEAVENTAPQLGL